MYAWGLGFLWVGIGLTAAAGFALLSSSHDGKLLKAFVGASTTASADAEDVVLASASPSQPGGSQAQDAGQSFIYVYELGQEFTEGVLQRKPNWYSVQYDAERNLTQLFEASRAVRTYNPQQATLFFVPMYTSWYLLSIYQDGLKNMREAVESTSKAWGSLLERVRGQHPYFNRTNGRDHFGIVSMDHGRCSALTFLDPAAYGDMFFLTLNGDKMVRSNHANKQRGIQALSYNYGAEVATDVPDIPCYMSDRDMVVPPLALLPTISPFEAERPIVMLFRFAPGQHHGVPISHHGHEIRRELFEMYKDENIPGWDIGVKGEDESRGDWPRSMFCAAPPGHSQWTSRPLKVGRSLARLLMASL
eukprot:jgi/Mesen1/1501/ME000132S00449